ncbi:hypothetical protein NNC19_02705 [Clostridium sp. SHJSY1]|uniref:hypothetical protein n=1 Tax=Clostridium sp. SHJSY1 TaxID=2942483 RepID=UPI00287563AD|nr:hypothetical protein [Clostridium sp. SHJSY1]MDS0524572.1 hypothetical protein [Clostridium sp. SHJSY1]
MNLKKIIAMFSVTILTAGLVLTGCGEKMSSPEETAQAFYDLYVLGDSSKLEKMGVDKAEYESTIEEEKAGFKAATSSVFSNFTLSEDQLNKIVDAEMGALKKLKAKIETTSTTEDTATVKMSSTNVDISSAFNKALEDARTEVTGMDLKTQEEADTKLVEISVNKIIENLNKLEPSTDTKEETFTFKKEQLTVSGKSKDFWIPEDMTKFGTDLGSIITVQNQ